MFNTIANLKYNSKGEKLEEWNVVGSIMAFDITPRRPIFRVIIGNQIVVSQQYHKCEKPLNWTEI